MAGDPRAAAPAPSLAMSSVTIVWSMMASACLTLAAMHLLVWSRRRAAWPHLLFSLSAAGVAVYAGLELRMLWAVTPLEYGMALRWAHVPAWVTIVSLVWFARLYLRAGRLWLAWTVCGMRTLALLLNFGPAPNLNYREISALRHISFLGDTVSAAEGVRNPWMLVGQLSVLLLLGVVAEASLAAAKRRPAAGADCGWKPGVLRSGTHDRVRPRFWGDRPCASRGEPPLPGCDGGDGLRAERRRAACREALGRSAANGLQAELADVGRVSTMAQLATGLAHELSQPLGAILRNAEAPGYRLQSSTPDLEEVRAILADICKDDTRAGDVIDHMRSLLKRRGLERVELRLAELVAEVVVLVQPDAASRKVRIAVEAPRTLPPVHGDRVHLQQVLLNLILNGMDAMAAVPAEGRSLVVRARQADAGTIEVSVADAGHGIEDAKLSRLFEPFFTTKPQGMGLGLPISATIIKAHGGRIWAESGPAGATFFFTVPVSLEA